MRSRSLLILFVLTFSSITGFAQKVHVKAINEPLSSVIKRLNAEVSFDNRLLSTYFVTIDQYFDSPFKAISYLISGKPLEMKKITGVYVITAKQTPQTNKAKDNKSKLTPAVRKIPDMAPINVSLSLDEIIITAASHLPSLSSEKAGESIQFNRYTADAMPGHSDNRVFNVLRMMPGIRTSGEPSDELYVWGSSPGESRITFDGIPLFKMQSYNSNISFINPYMYNEVIYKRGISSADEESQTGAKVEVTSDMSSITKPVVKAMLSTMSVNGFGSIPIGKNNVLSVAYRHTLNSIGSNLFNAYREKEEKEHSSESDGTIKNGISTTADSSSYALQNTTISPNYRFQDVNINLTGRNDSNMTYKITLYGGKDYLKYTNNDTLGSYNKQNSYQSGISGSLEKKWDNGNKSRISSYFSKLHSTESGNLFHYLSDSKENVAECNARFEQNGIGKLPDLSVGAEVTSYKVNNSQTTQTLVQPTIFATEKYERRNLNLETGLRIDFMGNGLKWQPRVLLSYSFLKYLTFTSFWGINNQYLVENPFAVSDGFYKFKWDINKSLKSYNTVAGIAFNKGAVNISVDGYLKNIRHSIWVVNKQLAAYNFNLRGLDVSTTYNWMHGLLFASWSLSKDKRQSDRTTSELKAGSMVRFYPFTFSLSYIYSTGYNSYLLPASSYNEKTVNGEENKNKIEDSDNPYSRMDISTSYDKQFKHFGISTGLSLINVFDKENEKCITSSIPRDKASTFYTRASRFTPIIFIELKF